MCPPVSAVGSLSNRRGQLTTSKPFQTPFTASPVHRIPSEIPRCGRGLISPNQSLLVGLCLGSALHLLTQMAGTLQKGWGRRGERNLETWGTLGTMALLTQEWM